MTNYQFMNELQKIQVEDYLQIFQKRMEIWEFKEKMLIKNSKKQFFPFEKNQLG